MQWSITKYDGLQRNIMDLVKGIYLPVPKRDVSIVLS